MQTQGHDMCVMYYYYIANQEIMWAPHSPSFMVGSLLPMMF
jgi:hypothetical protein